MAACDAPVVVDDREQLVLPAFLYINSQNRTRSLFRQVLRHIEPREREVNLAAVFFDDVLGLEALEM